MVGAELYKGTKDEGKVPMYLSTARAATWQEIVETNKAKAVTGSGTEGGSTDAQKAGDTEEAGEAGNQNHSHHSHHHHQGIAGRRQQFSNALERI